MDPFHIIKLSIQIVRFYDLFKSVSVISGNGTVIMKGYMQRRTV